MIAGLERAYVGLGSNLDGPARRVLAAFDSLRNLPGVHFHARSCLYRSPPMGPAGQPDFINAAAVLDCRCGPLELLDYLLDIERQQGRVRGDVHWGPRVIDLDLLVFGDAEIESDRLTVPHPGLHRRAFVLYPLAEIAPELEIPGLGGIRTLIAQCPRGELIQVDDPE